VDEAGHHRKDCRLREVAAGRVYPKNVSSAAKGRWHLKHNPTYNRILNPIYNLKKKRVLLAANLQEVVDDATILETQRMSPGTSASVSVLTDVDCVDL